MHLSFHLSCLAALLGLSSSRCLSPDVAAAPVETLGGCWFAVWGRQLASSQDSRTTQSFSFQTWQTTSAVHKQWYWWCFKTNNSCCRSTTGRVTGSHLLQLYVDYTVSMMEQQQQNRPRYFKLSILSALGHWAAGMTGGCWHFGLKYMTSSTLHLVKGWHCSAL